jgi:hypothetical protein
MTLEDFAGLIASAMFPTEGRCERPQQQPGSRPAGNPGSNLVATAMVFRSAGIRWPAAREIARSGITTLPQLAEADHRKIAGLDDVGVATMTHIVRVMNGLGYSMDHWPAKYHPRPTPEGVRR